MKKLPFLLALCLLLTCNVFSQNSKKTTINKPSKVETQQWIKEKLSSYSYNSEDGNTKNEYSISFDTEDIIIKNKHWTDLYGEADEVIRIPVVDIDYISITEKPKNVWLKIKLKDNKKVAFIYKGMTSYVEDYEFLLNSSFKENNLPERMKKAFANLIEYYGGKPANSVEAY